MLGRGEWEVIKKLDVLGCLSKYDIASSIQPHTILYFIFIHKQHYSHIIYFTSYIICNINIRIHLPWCRLLMLPWSPAIRSHGYRWKNWTIWSTRTASISLSVNIEGVGNIDDHLSGRIFPLYLSKKYLNKIYSLIYASRNNVFLSF